MHAALNLSPSPRIHISATRCFSRLCLFFYDISIHICLQKIWNSGKNN
jgi:hypothetical protein